MKPLLRHLANTPAQPVVTPTPAAKLATVLLRMFTQGSFDVIIRRDVCMCSVIGV